MKLIIVAVFAILTITSAINLKKLSPILAEVEKSPFGQATSALIQMSLGEDENVATGELNEIMELLNGLKQDNIDESASALAFYDQQKPIFMHQITEYATQLANLQAKLENYKVERDILQTEQIEKNKTLEETKQDIEDWTEEKATAEEELEAENSYFEQKNSELNAMIIAIEEGIRILNQMVHGTLHSEQSQYYDNAFVQVSNYEGFDISKLESSFTQLKPKFEEMFTNYKGKASRTELLQLSPVLSIFSTLANASKNNLNMDKYLQIIELLVSLLDGLHHTQNELISNHEATVLLLETQITDLGNWLEVAKVQVQTLSARLIEISVRLNELNQLIPECNDDITATGIALQDTKDEWDNIESTYLSEQEHRDAELEILEQLIHYFQTEVAMNVENIDDEVHNDSLTA